MCYVFLLVVLVLLRVLCTLCMVLRGVCVYVYAFSRACAYNNGGASAKFVLARACDCGSDFFFFVCLCLSYAFDMLILSIWLID